MDKKYEGIFIIKNYEDPEALEEVINRINNVIAAECGSIYYKDRMGIKRLAYEVKGQKEGYYYLINFKIPEFNIKDVKGRISIEINTLENVIKHFIVEIND